MGSKVLTTLAKGYVILPDRKEKKEVHTLLQLGMSSCNAFIFSLILSLRLCIKNGAIDNMV